MIFLVVICGVGLNNGNALILNLELHDIMLYVDDELDSDVR